jgi:hypothetical protein
MLPCLRAEPQLVDLLRHLPQVVAGLEAVAEFAEILADVWSGAVSRITAARDRTKRGRSRHLATVDHDHCRQGRQAPGARAAGDDL